MKLLIPMTLVLISSSAYGSGLLKCSSQQCFELVATHIDESAAELSSQDRAVIARVNDALASADSTRLLDAKKKMEREQPAWVIENIAHRHVWHEMTYVSYHYLTNQQCAVRTVLFIAYTLQKHNERDEDPIARLNVFKQALEYLKARHPAAVPRCHN